MSKAAAVNFSIQNLTQTIEPSNGGVVFITGRSVRGPFADPSILFNSWSNFVSIFGGLSSDYEAPFLVKRLLENGASIRFCRVGHYTTISDRSTLDATKATPAPVILFEIDAAFVTGNDIDVTINTEVVPTVSFDTDSDTTFANLATAIQSLSTVKSAFVVSNPSGDNTMMFIIPENSIDLTVNLVTITGGASQPTDTQSDITSIVDDEGNTLFTLSLKNEGADGNNFNISIEPGSNGQTGYFKVSLSHQTESITEEWDNLFIEGNLPAGQQTYLKDLVSQSKYLNVTYSDHSSFSGQRSPITMSFSFIGGTNGTTPVDADYVGDSASNTGFNSFDAYDEAYDIACFENNTDAILSAGAAYADNRKDLIFFGHLPITLNNKTLLVNKRDSLSINTQYAYLVSGGVKVLDSITSEVVEKPELADVLSVAVKSAIEYGPWFSFAGLRRGVLNNVLGVVNNFGSAAKFDDLNDLANRQINMVINRNGNSVLWGNHSAQFLNDSESFTNVVRLLIFLRKNLKPTLESFLEEPNDIPTWRRIYHTVKPFLDGLVDSEAMYGYEWIGDQDAKNLSSLQINDPADVSNGKYKVNFTVQPIPGINEINIDIILTQAGVTFNDVSSQL